jgi:uncharacterized protein Smg (DUF494 family)
MTMSDALSTLLSELRERFPSGADVREVEIWLASRGYDARQIGEILAEFMEHVATDEGTTAARAGVTSANAAVTPANAAVTPAKAVVTPAKAVVTPAKAGGEGPTFRVLGPHERNRFTPEAWGHLLALSAAGALSPADREHLIERALAQADGRIGLAELRALLESAGFDENGPAATTIH